MQELGGGFAAATDACTETIKALERIRDKSLLAVTARLPPRP
jgi:hypothetical protein